MHHGAHDHLDQADLFMNSDLVGGNDLRPSPRSSCQLQAQNVQKNVNYTLVFFVSLYNISLDKLGGCMLLFFPARSENRDTLFF